MDFFFYIWLIILGLCVLVFLGIHLMIHRTIKHDPDYQKPNKMYWFKAGLIIFGLSLLFTLVMLSIEKIGILGIIILIGMPGALISMLGKK